MHKLDDLIIWKKSMKLAKVIYTITDTFPKDERFGIISQMRRASISIASNITEEKSKEAKSLLEEIQKMNYVFRKKLNDIN